MSFAMNLMIVPGMFVCSSFLISVCMFIVSKALLMSSATVIVRTRGAIWLDPFDTVYLVSLLLSVEWVCLCWEMGRLERESQHCLPKDRLYST